MAARRFLRFGSALLIALAVVVGAAALVGRYWVHRPAPLHETVRIVVPPGATVKEAARKAAEATGVPRLVLERWLVARVPANRLRAGTYAVSPGATPADIVGKFERGDVVYVQLTVPEGWTFAQMRSAMAASGVLRIETEGWTGEQLMERLGAGRRSPEGWFMPDTYRFAEGSSDLGIYRSAYQAMRTALQSAWDRRRPDLPLASIDEALTLASIVEKETGVASDRAKVAAVFINRLRIGMRLQTDPTVIYGLGDKFDGNLRRRDLDTDTPYNTYTRAGLPPTPIALPGRASIDATFEPAPIKALYFVARGDGSSEFSESLGAHNRAVDRFQRGRP